MDTVRTPPAPSRVGLPLDPVLQLWAGDAKRAQNITVGASGEAQLCTVDPMRLVLMVLPLGTNIFFNISPSRGLPLGTTLNTRSGVPFVFHCRDYPGFTQGEWYVQAGNGDEFAVWEYTLSDRWGK